MAKLETLIITKEGYIFLRNRGRKKLLLKPLTKEQEIKAWNERTFKNLGADNNKYPLYENEIRIDKHSFNQHVEKIAIILKENNLPYRQDGFIEECCNV
jgi:hypothetical protein